MAMLIPGLSMAKQEQLSGSIPYFTIKNKS